jgi:hypothetical protein
MAASITWDRLRELASFRADQGCAVSLYLSLDPREVPTPAGVETRAHSLISEAHRLLEERKGSMAREVREALKHDIERIKTWFDDGFDRHGLRGIALFAAGLDNFWSTLPLPDPVADQVTIAGELFLAPLARFAGRADGVLVAAVGRERGHVFRLEAGNLVEIADETEDVPRSTARHSRAATAGSTSLSTRRWPTAAPCTSSASDATSSPSAGSARYCATERRRFNHSAIGAYSGYAHPMVGLAASTAVRQSMARRNPLLLARRPAARRASAAVRRGSGTQAPLDVAAVPRRRPRRRPEAPAPTRQR